MIRPDWNTFRYKFSDNPQNAFEWFCYLLVCKEFNRPKGLFRYKNQSRIETNPIEAGENVIGWQAKFYETTLGEHKADMLEGLKGCKKEYPKVNRIVFFTNKEWGPGKGGGDSQVKTDVEAKASELGIEIEWRTASYFEAPQVCLHFVDISSFFFTNNSGAMAAALRLQKHTQSILEEIKTCIPYEGKAISLERSDVIAEIMSPGNGNFILSGDGGVGKTAIVKTVCEKMANEETLLYLLRANEFSTNNTDGIFGDVTPEEFAELHCLENSNVVVFDSAEKLSEIDNLDTFKRTLRAFAKEKWKVIFTTRSHSAEDLQYLIKDCIGKPASPYQILPATKGELETLSVEHGFPLPMDERLQALIGVPFYLAEYLDNCSGNKDLNYEDFKRTLWSKTILCGNPEREQAFMRVASARAMSGGFYITLDYAEPILAQFHKDGILGYDSLACAYFIAHDIFEEWGLEKVVRKAFHKRQSSAHFFEQLGNSLPTRRALRRWVFDRLQDAPTDVTDLVTDCFRENSVSQLWKDDVIISVLKSNFARSSMDRMRDVLITDNHKVLQRMTFLLRLAGKEIDPILTAPTQSGTGGDPSSFEYYPTIPKGSGWTAIIGFVHDNIDAIGINNIWFVLPVLNDWTKKNKSGLTTRQAGHLAMAWYERLIKDDVIFSASDKSTKTLFETIISSANEIRSELKQVFDQIIQEKWTRHRDPYSDFVKFILSEFFFAAGICKLFPDEIIAICDMFWYKLPLTRDRFNGHSSSQLEDAFSLRTSHMDFYPSSAFQTPIYWLLQFHPNSTIEFLLHFINKVVADFAHSEFAKHEIKELNVHGGEGKIRKQWACSRFWGLYRGMATAPHLIVSIHMALEKYLLERAKKEESASIEALLRALLEKSDSVSITSIVASVVMANPEKTFEVALSLIKTKELFLYDSSRLVNESNCASIYGIAHASDYVNEMRKNERLETCKEKHRNNSLEHLAVTYQFFLPEGTDRSVAEHRQKMLWEIFDKHYAELSAMDQDSEETKTYRMFLARMDRRKMNPTVEEHDGSYAINFNPQMDEKLREFSEQSTQRTMKAFEHTTLGVWAGRKWRNDPDSSKYPQYEANPQAAISEAIIVAEELKGKSKPDMYSISINEEDAFYLSNYATPGLVCSVVLRDYPESLVSNADRDFCWNTISEFATRPLCDGYQYQVGDGTLEAVGALPNCLNVFPEKAKEVALSMLWNLLEDTSTGNMGTFVDVIAANLTLEFWKQHFDFCWSLVLGTLILRTKYNEFRHETIFRLRHTGNWEVPTEQIMQEFRILHDETIENVLRQAAAYEDCPEFGIQDINILADALSLLPPESDNNRTRRLLKDLLQGIAAHLEKDDRDNKRYYEAKHSLFEQIAEHILSLPTELIPEHMGPFLKAFNSEKWVTDFLEAFIIRTIYGSAISKFWTTWETLYEAVVKLCVKGDNYGYASEIVKTYLFASIKWKDTASHWEAFSDEKSQFFDRVTQNLGHCPSVLYSISRLVSSVGMIYSNSAIIWLSRMLSSHGGIHAKETKSVTVYYLEILCRRFAHSNRERIRKENIVKRDFLAILDFLVNKGSVTGFMLRESI